MYKSDTVMVAFDYFCGGTKLGTVLKREWVDTPDQLPMKR
jgi:hypothetical protein